MNLRRTGQKDRLDKGAKDGARNIRARLTVSDGRITAHTRPCWAVGLIISQKNGGMLSPPPKMDSSVSEASATSTAYPTLFIRPAYWTEVQPLDKIGGLRQPQR